MKLVLDKKPIFTTNEIKTTDKKCYIYRVKSVKKINSNIYKITFYAVNEVLTFKPGQYCKILCSDKKWRSYSIVDPLNCYEISIYINENRNSSSSFCYFSEGQEIMLKGPYGCSKYFYYNKKLIIVTKNIGIVPCVSIIDKYINHDVKAIIFWSIRNIASFEEILEKWTVSNNIVFNLYNNGSEDMLNKISKDIKSMGITIENGFYTYISGPHKFISLVKEVMIVNGYNSEFYDDMK